MYFENLKETKSNLNNCGPQEEDDNDAFIRNFDHIDNAIDSAGLKGVGRVNVDDIKPRKIVLVQAYKNDVYLFRESRRESGGIPPSCTQCQSHRPYPRTRQYVIDVGGPFKVPLPLLICMFQSVVLSIAALQSCVSGSKNVRSLHKSKHLQEMSYEQPNKH